MTQQPPRADAPRRLGCPEKAKGTWGKEEKDGGSA